MENKNLIIESKNLIKVRPLNYPVVENDEIEIFVELLPLWEDFYWSTTIAKIGNIYVSCFYLVG